MNSVRCLDANLPFEPSMRPAAPPQANVKNKLRLHFRHSRTLNRTKLQFGRTKPKNLIFSMGHSRENYRVGGVGASCADPLSCKSRRCLRRNLERAKGIEPSTYSL